MNHIELIFPISNIVTHPSIGPFELSKLKPDIHIFNISMYGLVKSMCVVLKNYVTFILCCFPTNQSKTTHFVLKK